MWADFHFSSIQKEVHLPLEWSPAAAVERMDLIFSVRLHFPRIVVKETVHFLTLYTDRYSPDDSIPLNEKLNYILFLYIGLF
jgi:hypothetical protein